MDTSSRYINLPSLVSELCSENIFATDTSFSTESNHSLIVPSMERDDPISRPVTPAGIAQTTRNPDEAFEGRYFSHSSARSPHLRRSQIHPAFRGSVEDLQPVSTDEARCDVPQPLPVAHLQPIGASSPSWKSEFGAAESGYFTNATVYSVQAERDGSSDLNVPHSKQESLKSRFRNHCGLGKRIFWLLVGAFVVLVLAGLTLLVLFATKIIKGIGPNSEQQSVAYATSPMAHTTTVVHLGPSHTDIPYPLPTGIWNFKATVTEEQGNCGDTKNGAVVYCINPYEVKFEIDLNQEGFYQYTSISAGDASAQPLNPPEAPSGPYVMQYNDSYNLTEGFENDQPCKVDLNVRSTFDAKYQYEVAVLFNNSQSCVFQGGAVAPAGQYCKCRWNGYAHPDSPATQGLNTFTQEYVYPTTTLLRSTIIPTPSYQNTPQVTINDAAIVTPTS